MKKYIVFLLLFLINTAVCENILGEHFSLEIFGQKMFYGPPSDAMQTGFHIPENYILGIDDELIINVWGAIEEEHRKTVEQDGAIFIPGIGKISLDGKTVSEARKIIREKFLGRYNNISVSVTTGKVRTIEVFILGEVKKPGNYLISPMTSILEVLTIAGGPTEKGSLRRIKITGKSGAVQIYDLYPLFMSGDNPPEIQFSRGDTVFVPLAEYAAGIKGAVRRPAIYEVPDAVTVENLIALSGGALPNADFSRLQVERIDKDKGRIIIDIDPCRHGDFNLNNFDIVNLPSLPEHLFYKVFLDGAVKRPGNYGWTEGLKAGAILKETELLPYALKDKAEIIRTGDDGAKRVIIISPEKIFSGEAGADIELMPQDKIVVYSQERREKRVSIQGQVYYPGEYVIVRGDRLSDLIKRAGGFTKYANLPGIVFLRESIRAEKEKQVAEFIRNKEEMLDREEKHTVKESEKALVEQGRMLIEQLKAIEIKGRIPLRIDNSETFVRREYDIMLEDGDVIYVPEKPISVAVTGEVNLPANIIFKRELGVADYIRKSGGYTKNADRRNVFIAKVDGTATQNMNSMEPGDTIVVPFETKEKRFTIIKDIVQMFYHLSLGLASF
ncbi:MAG: SLBB domain-containing protein [Candidatus Omnitrophica bacterium]|nr:SLBB domain-containing protein [Candidatus Omnitrophota bacterium]